MRKLADILAVIQGCTAVIHCAAVVDFRLFPDTALMYDVNIKGFVIITALFVFLCGSCPAISFVLLIG